MGENQRLAYLIEKRDDERGCEPEPQHRPVPVTQALHPADRRPRRNAGRGQGGLVHRRLRAAPASSGRICSPSGSRTRTADARDIGKA